MKGSSIRFLLPANLTSPTSLGVNKTGDSNPNNAGGGQIFYTRNMLDPAKNEVMFFKHTVSREHITCWEAMHWPGLEAVCEKLGNDYVKMLNEGNISEDSEFGTPIRNLAETLDKEDDTNDANHGRE